MTDRQVGGEGLQVDVQPPLVGERQAASLGVTVDYRYPLGVQFGALGLQIDLGYQPQVRAGTVGLMLDYIVSPIPTGAARWSGSVFEMGTASPVVRWSGSAFETAGTNPIVIWNADHFEMSP